MIKKINLQAFTSKERNEAIELLKRVISRHDGHIINFQFFSDIAISFTIEITGTGIIGLYEELKKEMSVNESFIGESSTNLSKDCWLLLHVSFIKGTGDKRFEIPDVPG
ncbi:MAG: hypothetical protein HKN68_03350 [Saprospiraceae bacterium]|nr:hypothetical protein [Saprospiraceae bacterium]